MLVIIFLVGGIFSYTGLSRLEDPEFTSKNAVIVTQYPGTSPQQVEEEVTCPIEKINLEIIEGKELYDAIFDSAVSRVRPISMAMTTTVLGMTPLLFDTFFKSMAVTIMFGLGFATIFTLIIVPVMYSILYKVKYKALNI